jgi:hypothetical protein
MADQNDLPEDSNDDAGIQDDGSPEDESQTVSLKQFKAAIASATKTAKEQSDAQLAALRGEIETLKARPTVAAPVQEEPKVYTRAQLKAFVTAGQLTEDQAETYWETQLRSQITKEVRESVAGAVTGTTRAGLVQQEVNGYKEVAPDVWNAGSPGHQKVRAEYDFLVSLGHPAAVETEVAALRAALGPLSALRASKNAKPGPADAHVETGGSNPAGSGKGSDDPLKKLSGREKTYWDRMIASGHETPASVRKKLTNYASYKAQRQQRQGA